MKSILNIFNLFFKAVSGSETEFTTGSIRKAIFMLSVPMILEMAMESLFAVVDIFFVGKISVNAVAAVGLTESVMAILYAIAIGLSIATTAVVARRIGEKKFKKAGDAAFQAILLGAFFSIFVSIAGLFFSEDILRLMGGDETLIKEGSQYTKIMYAGNLSIMLLFLINAIFRGAGNASIAMRSLWLANILNMILDPLLIFGFGPIPAMGIEGAAIATTTGRGIGVIYQLYHLVGGQLTIHIGLKNLQVKWNTIKNLFNISLGGIGQFLIESASWIFLVRVVSIFGNEAVASYTFAIRVIIFTILPAMGMANAAATLVGQNLGAGQPRRAEESVWKTAKYNMIFLAIVSVIFFLGAKPIIGFFTTEIEVATMAVTGLKVICLGYIFFAYGMVISLSFNGAGDTKTPTIINIVCFWLIKIPLAYLLAVILKFGVIGVFIAVSISYTIHALVGIIIFRRGTWKKVKV